MRFDPDNGDQEDMGQDDEDERRNRHIVGEHFFGSFMFSFSVRPFLAQVATSFCASPKKVMCLEKGKGRNRGLRNHGVLCD